MGEKECFTVKKEVPPLVLEDGIPKFGGYGTKNLLYIEASLYLGTTSRPILVDLRVSV